MVSGEASSAAILTLLLVLPITALVARRLSLSIALRYILTWATIFIAAVGLVMVCQRLIKP